MTIELMSSDVPQRTFVLNDLPALVGRNPTAHVHLKDGSIGQFQCIIEQNDGRLSVRDTWGGPGIFVNGVRARTRCLMPGDRLAVGKTEFVVQYERNEEIDCELTTQD
jgi:pSer/pThr/pTyr-binding forkhead associated (FHA) protein